MIVDDRLVKRVMYIPEAVATWDSNPQIINIGQNIMPPPIPQNAEMNAPNQAIPIKIEISQNFNFKSPWTNLQPQSILSLYSYLITSIAITKNKKHEKCKSKKQCISRF